ncbi:LytTR family DNA-binding domain-containing protein [Caballeronia sp. SEWSISQ10-4 2]|uniref:LytR/AlgR family response regulator transcription factor n=1 Tax=Caballeronia sp. SEWSISQ10-4 2 TaxID=2937438 RepID=UPI0026511184|nr:LytTR family DNA-binding domain-containing protein [Caballeronia sp. SEWSISQ10-4 2]MDN7181157.1 LytTR family DNA-binding domain-containing protein [Caballeronia sp. SEWSISQ10-4 2]
MKATVLIAEDEALLAADLQAQLTRLWPELHCVASVADGETAVEQALALQPDVLFLDIRMPGMTGLEVAQALAEDWPELAKPFPLLVFVTAYDQYALHAFEHAAVDYVLKPVQPDRLEKTCARLQAALRQRAQSQAAEPSWEAAIHTLRELLHVDAARPQGRPPVASPLRMIQASVGNTITMVPIADVLYFEAADKYVRLVTVEREHLIRISLRELQLQLDPECFWQVHRSTIVRCDAIASALRDDTGKLTLALRGHPDKLSVSRLYADRFRGL